MSFINIYNKPCILYFKGHTIMTPVQGKIAFFSLSDTSNYFLLLMVPSLLGFLPHFLLHSLPSLQVPISHLPLLIDLI